MLAALTATGLLAAGLATAGPAGGAGASRAHTELTALQAAGRMTGAGAKNPFCEHLGTRYQASAGAHGFCFGAQPNVGGHPSAAPPQARIPGAGNFNGNFDAANLAEDVNHGVRGNGQSETSIAAAGSDVVEAWNDSTAFYSTCKSIENKAEITGFGYSADGGNTFTDLGGLPNANCDSYLFEGDPSVAVYRTGGKTWFYISSLYDSQTGSGTSQVAMDVCQAEGTKLSCDAHPVVLANSTHCQPGGKICDFLDKDFITIDPVRHRLYATYTDFPSNATTATTAIDATMCSLNNPGRPFCEVNKPGKPAYLTLAPAGTNPCEREGAYPAVDTATGDLYVGYEFNWFSSESSPVCTRHVNRVQEVLDRVPGSCLTRTTVARCAVNARAEVPIVSMEAAPLPGYSRFDMNDFPRIAVSNPFRTVSLVWNDATHNPLGEIMLQSFRLKSLIRMQKSPVPVGQPDLQASNVMPAIRNTTASGLLDISWYNLEWSAGISPLPLTTVWVASDVSPLATGQVEPSRLLTSQGSDWTQTTSDINPNFGDYIDNYIAGSTLYVAWSDGRIGIPQPFEVHLKA